MKTTSLKSNMANGHLLSIIVASRTAALAAVLLMTGVIAVSANAQTNSTWIDGTGNWSISTNWNPGVVPNNSGSTTYSVTIRTSNSVVTMDVLNDTINNLTLGATDTLNISPGNSLSLVSGASSNYGTLAATGIGDDGGRLTINSGASLTNLASIELSSGTLANDGTFINASGAVIHSLLIGSGITNNGAGASFVNSGIILLDGSGFMSNSGTFSNKGTINATGLFDSLSIINSGIFNNSGTFSLFGACNNGCAINNSGTFNNSGAISIQACGGASPDCFFSNSGTLNNTGTINATFFGGGAFTESALITFSNSGTLNNSGTINATFSSCVVFGSSCTYSNSGTLNNTGAITFSNNSAGLATSFTNAGKLNNTGGTIYNESASTLTNSGTLNNTSHANLINSGTLDNFGTLNNTSHANLINSGTLDNFGTLNNTSHANLINSGTLDNFGTLNNTSHANLINSGTLSNAGTLTDGSMINNTGTFTNSGAVTISKSGQFTTSTNYTQTAGSTFVNGTLTSTGSAIVNVQGGTLGGGGRINGNVLMGGTMIAGTPGNPLTFNINGNYEQIGTGTYTELISRNANGLLNVSGSATLDPGASLDIDLLGGFDPKNGTSFTIMDYGFESGTFDISDPFFNGGTQQWVISSYNGGDGDDIVLTAEAVPVLTAEVLTAGADSVATPEPGTVLLLGLGLLGLGGYTRKKRGAGAQ